MIKRLQDYFKRRSANKAAEALYQFMVLNDSDIPNELYEQLCVVRGYLLTKG